MKTRIECIEPDTIGCPAYLWRCCALENFNYRTIVSNLSRWIWLTASDDVCTLIMCEMKNVTNAQSGSFVAIKTEVFLEVCANLHQSIPTWKLIGFWIEDDKLAIVTIHAQSKQAALQEYVLLTRFYVQIIETMSIKTSCLRTSFPETSTKRSLKRRFINNEKIALRNSLVYLKMNISVFRFISAFFWLTHFIFFIYEMGGWFYKSAPITIFRLNNILMNKMFNLFLKDLFQQHIDSMTH